MPPWNWFTQLQDPVRLVVGRWMRLHVCHDMLSVDILAEIQACKTESKLSAGKTKDLQWPKRFTVSSPAGVQGRSRPHAARLAIVWRVPQDAPEEVQGKA